MSEWKAHYILKIIPEEKKIQVDATIQIQQAYDEIWLEIPTYSFDELISDVRALDKEGNLLPLENVSDESYDGWPIARTLLWRLSNVPQIFRLAYTVHIVYREWMVDGDDRGVSQHLVSVMNDDYALITTYGLLMAIQKENLSLSHLKITFDAPADWEIATLWHPVEGIVKTYVLNDVSTFHFVGWGHNAWFALGKFRLHQKTICGVELTSVICGEEYAFSDATFFSILTKLVDYVMSFYRSKTTSCLFVAVTPWIATKPKDTGSIAGLVTNDTRESRYVILAMSSGIDDEDLPEKATLIAHELFHTGNPGFDTSNGQAYWFSEGFTTYYHNLIMTRLGFKKPEDFWQTMARMYQAYDNAYETLARSERAVATCSSRMFCSKGASCIVYQGGAIVALMLDIQIRCATENACSLDDVMREMFFHSRQLGSLKQEDFATILQEVCGQDLEDTLTNYIDTAEKLPLNEVLSLIGLEYYDGQILIASDKVHNQSIRVVYEVNPSSHPLHKKSKG